MIVAATVFTVVVGYGVWRRVTEQASLRAYCRDHGHAWDKMDSGELVCLRCSEGVRWQPWQRYLNQ
jgi:hypothetical protein